MRGYRGRCKDGIGEDGSCKLNVERWEDECKDETYVKCRGDDGYLEDQGGKG